MLTWHEVMRIALYEPGLGYYRQGVRRIGRGGDFYTSVSVGPLFGSLLAQHCAESWRRWGEPGEFVLMEQGAHDGTLAKDLMIALERDHPRLFSCAQYLIIEPDETLREAQRRSFAGAMSSKLQHLRDWNEVTGGVQGVLVCNELLDAFPVHRMVLEEGCWREAFVRNSSTGGFEFVTAPASIVKAEQELGKLSQPFADGHATELNLDMATWLQDIDQSGFVGEILIADYGHAAPEYFSPERREGTLRRYHQHKSDDKVLEGLGQCDLTAHVNFTHVAQEAESLGWQVTEFIEQGRFLTRAAADIMKRPGFQPDAAWMRQFQTLTHPGHLGHSFQIMTLEKGMESSVALTNERVLAALRRLGFSGEKD